MKEKNKVVGVFICIAMIAALLSFFAPYVAVSNYYYTDSQTGFEVLEMAMEEDDAGLPILALAATGLALLFAWVCRHDGSRYGFPMAVSVVAGGSMWIYFSEAMDYVTTGFWIFMAAHVVAVVLGGSLYLSTQSSTPVAQTDTESKAKGSYCPECGTRLAAGTKFCPDCGTSLRTPAENKETES